ncbi:hypothetical protein [Nocardiopsis dassonvillei]|uniref:hypothetical protein n=1 Tax=Nocardiopsis dassonvillei TaxID=2014 RepID=UPI003F56EC30
MDKMVIGPMTQYHIPSFSPGEGKEEERVTPRLFSLLPGHVRSADTGFSAPAEQGGQRNTPMDRATDMKRLY